MIRAILLAALLALQSGPATADGERRPLSTTVLNRLTLADLTPCDGSESAPFFELPAEATALRAERQVRRHGRRLRVGRAVFRNRVMDAELGLGESHGYIGRYAGVPIVLLASTVMEGWGFTLVDPASGRFIETAGVPVLGPDGHTFVGAPRNEDYHDAAIEISEWRGGRFVDHRVEIAACGLAWDGPDRITFRSGFAGGAPGALERRDGVWGQVGSSGAP